MLPQTTHASDEGEGAGSCVLVLDMVCVLALASAEMRCGLLKVQKKCVLTGRWLLSSPSTSLLQSSLVVVSQLAVAVGT